jgi:leucyl-tRNA synthetase
LGEERVGDRVVVHGRREAGRVIASSVVVDSQAGEGDGLVVGELVRRTENVLQVETGEGVVTVEVPETATIDIPGVEGANDVHQLKHHLDVQRMSKSKGNVVNPDELVEEYGADTVRTYIMFAFEWQKGGPWDSRGIVGARRFLDDVWRLGAGSYRSEHPSGSAVSSLRRTVHQTIAKLERDLSSFKWNTAVAALMSLRNELLRSLRAGDVSTEAWDEGVEALLLMLAPIAPHITEELWRTRGHERSIHLESWPTADPEAAADEVVTMVVQVNGKVRDRLEVPVGITAERAEELALATDKIKSWIEPGVRKVIIRPPNLVNIVV